MFETSHHAVKLGALIASSLVVLGGAAAAAGALPSPIQTAAHDALGAAGISVPGGGSGTTGGSDDVAVSTTDSTTTTTGETTTTTTIQPNDSTAPEATSNDPNGPDPNGPAKYGLCTAYAAGNGSANGKKTSSTAFQALARAAASAGETVTEFCADATPGGQSRTADTTTATTETSPTPAIAHPGSTRGHGPDVHGNPHQR